MQMNIIIIAVIIVPVSIVIFLKIEKEYRAVHYNNAA